MSSFYGNAGLLNFDKLKNQSVPNKYGTEEEPVVLYELNEGDYIVHGPFKYNGSEEDIAGTATAMRVTVTIDPETRQKNIYYSTIEGGEYVIHLITYSSDDASYIPQRLFTEEIVFVDSLPSDARESLLYVYNDSIYQYKNGEFTVLHLHTWGEF